MEAEEPDNRCGASAVGDVARAVMSVEGMILGTASEINGDKGSNSFFCLMVNTIFSRWSELMCLSLPVLVFAREASISRGSVLRPETSEATESMDEESSGISSGLGLGRETPITGVVLEWGCVSQQNVSLFHILQLKFSRRRPSSNDSAHFENTATHFCQL